MRSLYNVYRRCGAPAFDFGGEQAAALSGIDWGAATITCLCIEDNEQVISAIGLRMRYAMYGPLSPYERAPCHYAKSDTDVACGGTGQIDRTG
eukprot:1103275-Rhodomonas_salina.3